MKNGYLIISANKGLDKDEKDKKGKEKLPEKKQILIEG